MCFQSQFYREGSTEPETRIAHPEFLSAMESRARYFGALIGVKYGEGFTSREPLRTDDPVALFAGEPWRRQAAGSRAERGTEESS